MKNGKIHSKIFLFLLVLFVWSLLNPAYVHTQTSTDFNHKIKGVNFRGPYDPSFQIDRLENVKIAHANWITLIPEATLERTTLILRPDSENNFWSETIEANIEGIQLAKSIGLKVMLKPHIILGPIPSNTIKSINLPGSDNTAKEIRRLKDKTRGAKWRGDFVARNKADWKTWENSYESYIINLARIADSLDVDMFCIGTELKKSATKRPEFWKALIRKVRKIYSGPVIYSANWDEYNHISFWKQLDYIAVNTYFPISHSKTPKVKKTARKWKSIRKKLKAISKKENKQILLTEFGYRNVDFAGRRPWMHDREDNKSLNNQAQTNLYQAFFKTFWKQSWIAGGFCWQWFHKSPDSYNTTFSIQDKPALNVLQMWYADQNSSK